MRVGDYEWSNIDNRWFHFSQELGEFSFQRTEDYLWGRISSEDEGRRIGDMTRDELMQVIATGYLERDKLATAVLLLAPDEVVKDDGLSHCIALARLIVAKLEGDLKKLREEGRGV